MSIDPKTALIVIEAGKVVEVRKWGTLEDIVRGIELFEFNADDPPEPFWDMTNVVPCGFEVEFGRDFKPPSPSSRPYRDEPEVCGITVKVDWGEGDVDVDMRPLMFNVVRDASRRAMDFERGFAKVQELLGDDGRCDELARNITDGIRRRIKKGGRVDE